MYTVTNATNYDILVGQQTLYLLGFVLDNWTEETCIRPGWSAGDGRRELIPVAFATTTTIASLFMIFGCGDTIGTLPCDFTLSEDIIAVLGNIEDQREMIPLASL